FLSSAADVDQFEFPKAEGNQPDADSMGYEEVEK
ncbi:hypothetical protein CCACVL1_18092, partial [Corchorus capsularis]